MKLLICILTAMITLSAKAIPVNSPNVGGCSEQDFVVGEKTNIVSYNDGFQYTPKCLVVSKGSVVTFMAEGFHPIAPIPSANNPIPQSNETVTVTFDNTGVFGYFCPRHGNPRGQGMAGAVMVVEELF